MSTEKKLERKKLSKKDQVVATSIWRIVYESTLTRPNVFLDSLKKYLQHSRYRDIGIFLSQQILIKFFKFTKN
jgi:hypothetical protein